MVKCSTKLRLLAASLMTVLLLANAPSVQATAFQDAGPSFRVQNNGNNGNNGNNWNNWKKGKKGKKGGYHVPEGSAGGMLILAAGALGGGVLVWRRKRRAIVA